MKQAVRPIGPFKFGDDDHASTSDGNLVKCLGREIRNIRKQHDLTVVELTELAGLSSGSLSKIENGLMSPSLNTLKRLATALDVSVPALFCKDENRNNAIFVPAGGGVNIYRRGSSAALANKLLGRKILGGASLESSITTINEVPAPRSHTGAFLLYMLEGHMEYNYESVIYSLGTGDSLFFNAEAAHGPEKIIKKPVRFLSVIAKS
ncbi:MAG: XRE family transcriptional regulator [Alphaproteobacteria bacterium]|jgi:DNA-binding XRE family transcriptional regulator|nr:XRE family transcriptional regulator [Alphaproteobacteria bacterium]|tara:strand:+ start:513 stop:1133 length:621 start_codon:yes stop_codon:yes gene_type:complete